MARALALVGYDFGGYNLLTNNCEHFANWCASGARFSNQVPSNEGERHSVGEKAFEKVVAEPVLKALDDVSHSLDRLVEKTDEFFSKWGRIRFPWE